MWPIQAPFDALVSAHYFSGVHEPVIAEAAKAGMTLIGDSGAYSAMSLGKPVDIDKFCGWVERNQKHLCWVASLDAIGHPEQSLANYQYMVRNGLAVVPTVHFPADPRELDRYADRQLVGLGGVAARKDHKTVLKWLVSMFRYARATHPAMRFHGWGMTRSTYIDHLPFYSVDSSAFGAGYRYGRVSVWDPAAGRRVSFWLDQKAAAGRWSLLRSRYGVSAVDVATSGPLNRELHVVLSALTARYMGEHYTRRHHVSPPVGQTRLGTRIHLADSSPETMKIIAKHVRKGST